MKRLIACLLALVLMLGVGSTALAAESKKINNSSLLPKYLPDSQVKLDDNNTPEWIKSLIIGEINVQTFGTFGDLEPVLKHCAETGINALWITPINDKGVDGNGYSNLGPHTIDPFLTGQLKKGEEWRQMSNDEYEKGWKIYKKFVDLAHSYNIRIFMDIVSWGTMKTSQIYEEHPEWYDGTEVYGGYHWYWEGSDELADWFVKTLTDVAVKTGIDGFRYDLEPSQAGYIVNARVKASCLEAGRKMVYFAEMGNERGNSYDFAEADIIGPDYVNVQYHEGVFLKNNIVDSIKNGTYIGSEFSQETADSGNNQYYSHMISCHDAYSYGSLGNRLVIGYQALYAPFIPIWALGEEFNNSKNGTANNILYMNTLKLDQIKDPVKGEFFEDVKKMISIRRTYSDIFEYFPETLRSTNICEVKVTGAEELQSYARFSGNKGIMIVPNNNIHEKNSDFKIYLPFADMELDYYDSYTVTDLLTGKKVVSGNAATVHSFTAKIKYEHMGVYLVEAKGERNLPEEETEETYDEWYNNPVEDSNEFENGNSEQNKKPSTTIKKVIKRIVTSGLPVWAYVLIGIGSAAVIGGTVFLIIFLKKRKKNKVTGE